ncbi:translation initiation factor IF-2 [Manduca sexta]|uniref:translation initiation factor IF-2 n=1 Tax=Manduca sexta TaxID=7130 RepID=UPI00188F5581|nr:translation initiation factor IF-2 [Manduca sexta]XP_037299863.1 translation initiation factor IF-2 [Manduca sexta]
MMSNASEQNGRQAQQTTPPTDPRIRNVPAPEEKFCRDFIWGICTKGSQCKFPHIRDFESMKSTLKFCRDFQNKVGCRRPDCTFLHTTREEEKLFLSTGQIPRVLMEWYSAMSTPVNAMAEGMPQNMLYTGDYRHQPPPPPPAGPSVAAALPPPLPYPPLPALLAPPPPPPPPTEASTPIMVTGPKYTSSQSTPVVLCPVTQAPPVLPPNFDASKPPPPLPQHPNRAQKRAAESCEAGPSKARKADNFKGIDLCDSCVQRNLRLKLYRQEIIKLQHEKEQKTLLLERKLEDYENDRLLLKSIVNPELYQILEEYVEGPSSVRSDDTILLSLSTPSRARPSTITISSPEVLRTVLELMRTTTTTAGSDRLQMTEALASDHLTIEPRPSTSSVNSRVLNGLHSLLNVQRTERPSHEVVAPRFPSVPSAAPSGYQCPAATAAPGSYVPYQPAVPPPAVRPFYAQPYPSTSNGTPNTNAAFNPSARMGVPQTFTRPNVPGTATANMNNMQNFNQYMYGQFPPQPPYYPPAQ